MKRLLAVAALCLLTSCASAPDNPAANPEAVAPLLCQGKEQCALYWQRAQAWVAANNTYKIQLANDTVIQTFGPFNARVDLAYLITKVPSSADSAQIIIATNCDNFIRCYPTRTDAIIAFKRFVRN